MPVERSEHGAVGQRHPLAEKEALIDEHRLHARQEVVEVADDGVAGDLADAEHRQRAAHRVGKLIRCGRITRRRSEGVARVALALGRAPAMVHRRQDHEFVGVDLEQVGDDPLYRRRRQERGLGASRFEGIDDVAGVLPGVPLRGDYRRQEEEPAGAPADLPVHVSIGQDLLEVEALGAKGCAGLAGEVGALAAEEAKRRGILIHGRFLDAGVYRAHLSAGLVRSDVRVTRVVGSAWIFVSVGASRHPQQVPR